MENGTGMSNEIEALDLKAGVKGMRIRGGGVDRLPDGGA